MFSNVVLAEDDREKLIKGNGNITITNVNIPNEEVTEKTSHVVFMVPLHGDEENVFFELPKIPGEKIQIEPKHSHYVIINFSSPNGEYVNCDKKDFTVDDKTKFDILVGYRETEDGTKAYCEIAENQ